MSIWHDLYKMSVDRKVFQKSCSMNDSVDALHLTKHPQNQPFRQQDFELPDGERKW
jgi:hypothetical protein